MPRNVPSSDPIDIAFSAAVKQARGEAGLTQIEVSECMDYAVAPAQVGWIERGHGCNLRTAIHLSRALGISLDGLDYGSRSGNA